MNRGPANPLALGLIIVGAAAMAIAAFLPLDEPVSMLGMVQHNSLIQHGGWALIALALGIAANGFRASRREGKHWQLSVVLCLLAAAQIVSWFMDKDMRTLYPVGPDGTLDTSRPGTVAALGIALYVAGAGVAVALFGTLMLRQTEKSLAEDPSVAAGEAAKTTKKCPDCAETILADAKVCKHCGYRFPLGNVTCNHCQHVQAVPLGQQRFVCEQCGTKLKRLDARTAPDAPQKRAPRQHTMMTCPKCQHVQAVPLSQPTFVCEECGMKLKRRTPVEGS